IGKAPPRGGSDPAAGKGGEKVKRTGSSRLSVDRDGVRGVDGRRAPAAMVERGRRRRILWRSARPAMKTLPRLRRSEKARTRSGGLLALLLGWALAAFLAPPRARAQGGAPAPRQEIHRATARYDLFVQGSEAEAAAFGR